MGIPYGQYYIRFYVGYPVATQPAASRRINTYVYDNSGEREISEISKIYNLLCVMFLSWALNKKRVYIRLFV
jgi:hypothetical protein